MVKSRNPKVRVPRSRGFSLVELMIALIVIVIGVLGVSAMVMLAINMQAIARDTTFANSLAEDKLEELRNLAPAHAWRQDGDYEDPDFDPSGAFTVRWTVDDGLAGTQKVVIVVDSNNPNREISDIRIETQIPTQLILFLP